MDTGIQGKEALGQWVALSTKHRASVLRVIGINA